MNPTIGDFPAALNAHSQAGGSASTPTMEKVVAEEPTGPSSGSGLQVGVAAQLAQDPTHAPVRILR